MLQSEKLAHDTVGHIPREISRYTNYFIKEVGTVDGIVLSTIYRQSPIPSGGTEIAIQLNFEHDNEQIRKKMKKKYYKTTLGMKNALTRKLTMWKSWEELCINVEYMYSFYRNYFIF